MRNIINGCILFILASCGNKEIKPEAVKSAIKGNSVQLTAAQQKTAAIETGQAIQKSMPTIIRLNGQIDVPPQNLVSVSFPLGGYLKTTQLMPGMKVTKGQPIAVLEDQQFIQIQQDYLTAKARQTFIESEYNRQKELNAVKASSDKVFQQIAADYRENTIKIKALSEKLILIGINPTQLNENTLSRAVRIVAPISGFVSKVNVNIGKYVNPADVLFEIVNPDDIHLRLSVFEKDIAQLSIGQKVVAWTANDPNKRFDCEIVLISRDVSADRTMDVHCHFLTGNSALVPGMYMIGEVAILNNNALTVPNDAVVHFENKDYIFTETTTGTYEMIEVKTGGSENGFIQINGGENELAGKTIVVKNAYTLLMKMKNSGE